MKAEELRGGCLLRDFDEPLTCFHSCVACASPEHFEQFFGPLLRANLLSIPCRLHRSNVMLFREFGEPDRLIELLNEWLRIEGFDHQHQFHTFRCDAGNCFEQGFISCLRLRRLEAELDGNDELEWHQLSDCEDAVKLVSDFHDEERSGFRSFDLTGQLRSAKAESRRFVDDEDTFFEFAASAWSPMEFRVWSRTVQIPK